MLSAESRLLGSSLDPLRNIIDNRFFASKLTRRKESLISYISFEVNFVNVGSQERFHIIFTSKIVKI